MISWRHLQRCLACMGFQIDDEPAGMTVRAVGRAGKFLYGASFGYAHDFACGLPCNCLTSAPTEA
jgi:hypothetical protein